MMTWSKSCSTLPSARTKPAADEEEEDEGGKDEDEDQDIMDLD